MTSLFDEEAWGKTVAPRSVPMPPPDPLMDPSEPVDVVGPVPHELADADLPTSTQWRRRAWIIIAAVLLAFVVIGIVTGIIGLATGSQ